MRNAGNLGIGFQGMQMGAGGMSGLTNQYMGADQYQRDAARQIAMDPFVRGQAGLGALQGALGPYGTTTENIQEGNFFQDALGLGLTAAGAAFGGPAGATMGAQLGGLGGSQGGGGAPGFMGNWNNYLPTNMMPGMFNQQPSNALFSGYGGLGGLGGGAQGSLFQGGGFF
jgi:hypothetical protein